MAALGIARWKELGKTVQAARRRRRWTRTADGCVSVTVTLTLNGVAVPVTLDDDALEAITLAVEQRRAEAASPCRCGGSGRLLGVAPERIYKRLHLIPHYREGGRLLFRRDELDSWIHGLCGSASVTGSPGGGGRLF